MLRTRNRVRTAALRAEIIALRATVTSLRDELGTLQAQAATAAVAAAESAAALASAAAGQVSAPAGQASAPAERVAAPAEQVAAPAEQVTTPGYLTLDLPLVRLALADVAVDRGPDTALTEMVLSTSPQDHDEPAETPGLDQVARLPERKLLDPKADRNAEPVDLATATPVEVADPVQHRRTA